MSKKRNDYFVMMNEQAECCAAASNLLEKIICSYSIEEVHRQRDEIHEIERKADDIHHEIITGLAAEFITPIDQEDILRLVQVTDDVTDALDEVVQNFYMFHVDRVTPEMVNMAVAVNRCVEAFREAVSELKSFKKPQHLRKLLSQVNLIESEADAIYTDAIYKLFADDKDNRTLISRKVIYDSLEACCDTCEDAADIIEQIVIKNT